MQIQTSDAQGHNCGQASLTISRGTGGAAIQRCRLCGEVRKVAPDGTVLRKGEERNGWRFTAEEYESVVVTA